MKVYAKERNVYVLLLVGMCLISFYLGYYMYKHNNPKEIKHIPINDSVVINVMPLKAQDFIVKKSYIGKTEAINQVQIVPFVSGYIDSISIKEGSFVNEGDLLININPDEYSAKLLSADANVLQAQSNLEYTKSYYERVQKSGKNTFSETEIENAKNNYTQAEATYKEALANQLFAKINYNYTIIKAPISGKIGNFNLSVGDYVSPNDGGLIHIIQTTPIKVVFSLSDVEYINMLQNDGKLFKDTVIKLKLANGDIFENSGEFKYSDNQLNKNTNSLSVYAYFDNKNNILLPNSFVNIETSKELKNIILIKKQYVKMKEDGNFINIARNNSVIYIPVNIIAENLDEYAIKNTLQDGDMLVLDDTSAINKDTKVIFNTIK